MIRSDIVANAIAIMEYRSARGNPKGSQVLTTGSFVPVGSYLQALSAAEKLFRRRRQRWHIARFGIRHSCSGARTGPTSAEIVKRCGAPEPTALLPPSYFHTEGL
jgi:hypothetical protein